MPVHLKGGVGDAVLYRATMGLTVLGMLLRGVVGRYCSIWLHPTTCLYMADSSFLKLLNLT